MDRVINVDLGIVNADYNAAKNISHPDIEQLVENELKRQKHELQQLKAQ